MKIFFAESSYEIPDEFRIRYETELKNAYEAASALLPFGSKHINFFVQPREYDLIDETNDHGKTHNSDFLEMAFNPTLDEAGLDSIIADIKPTVFHEMNHAARWNIPIWHTTFLDGCIMEGLANVFTRQYAQETAPWADYAQEDVVAWLKEIQDAGEGINQDEYMFSHPDGRRWIGYKVGTYIVDKAIKKSGKSIVDLTAMECADILKLAAT
jgi:uncharacterized protein YjaZ